MTKTYQELLKERGVVTQEMWNNAEFRREMYNTVLDTGGGASGQYDDAKPVPPRD